MGGHYGSIHIRTDDAMAVRSVLEELSRAQGTKFLLGPMTDGWVTAFPDENGQDFGVSEALAQKISAPILHCVVFDDDVFTYQFRNGGKLVDSYNSCPDYFDESSESSEPRGGNVDLLEPILPNSAKRDELKRLLDAEEFTFEMERLEKFAALLGLSNAATAYEYLQDGERDGIRQWKQFVHIPDQSTVRAAKRAAKAKAAAGMKEMAKDGLLVLEIQAQKHPKAIFYNSPMWCIDPRTSDVLLVWTSADPAVQTRVSRINPQTGKATTTDLEFSDPVCCLAVSPTGQWLAGATAYGQWKTCIWDSISGKLVKEFPQLRASTQVCFSHDGKALLSLSQQAITVSDLAGGSSVTTIALPDSSRTMVLHPGGEYLAAESAGLVTIVHLPTRAVKSVWIPMPPGPNRDLMEYAASQGIGQKFLSEIGGHVPMEEVEATRARMARHFLPRQGVFSLSFGALGNYLFCGTSEGVCALAWDKVMAVADMAAIDPQAFVPAEPRIRENGTQDNQLIYSVPVDSVQRRILFAGLEGKVKFANVADERIGDLLSPPIKRPFWELQLTPDRTALVGTAVVLEPGGKPQPSCFQIWNYKALCEAAGLDW